MIADDPSAAFRFTNRANLVAVVSNGTAVLGLGNIGPLASKPVMEGKAVLFKRFADIDVFDLEIDASDPEDVIRFCEMLAPTVGGINLEDIKAPDCFFDRVHPAGTARRPGLPRRSTRHGHHRRCRLHQRPRVDRRRAEDVKVVFSGAGAAGVATARFFRELGVQGARTCSWWTPTV